MGWRPATLEDALRDAENHTEPTHKEVGHVQLHVTDLIVSDDDPYFA